MRPGASVTLSLRDLSSTWLSGRSGPMAESTFAARTMSSRLLLIDDDARLSAMVGDYLRNAGFDVTTAGSLGAGRERLAAENFDALVLDLMLPDGDGPSGGGDLAGRHYRGCDHRVGARGGAVGDVRGHRGGRGAERSTQPSTRA